MLDNDDRLPATAPGILRNLARKRQMEDAEHCDLCNEVIAASHPHLLQLAGRTIVCVCQACSLLFSDQGSGAGKYKLIPRRYLTLTAFSMADEQWESLLIPVNMAFIYRSTGEKPVMAYYPSPAGATESLLDLAGWLELVNRNPILNELEPDVEALLINRVRGAHEYYLVPIDACYQLVGLMRVSWRGLSGGTEVWEAIARYFQEIRARAGQVKGGEYA